MKLPLYLLLTLVSLSSIGQDSTDLSYHKLDAYTFNIIDGQMFGNGATFLKAEMSKAQFTLLGEYHGSARISEFAGCVIPILDSLGYKSMVLEVGRFAGKSLNHLGLNSTMELKSMLEKYKFYDEYGDLYLPIPFIENSEDAKFIEKCKSHKWKIMGIDQEFYDGLLPLFDMMFNNLSPGDQQKLEPMHKDVIDSLQQFYLQDYNENKSIMSKMTSSPLIAKYYAAVSNSDKNKDIIASIKESCKIYQNDWYSNYSSRIQHMKNNLREQLEENNFNTSKDKILAKMGAYHLSKGFSLWGAYEVGNTFNEMANYHGNTALNILFLRRYYINENQEIKDLLESKDPVTERYHELRKYGKRDEWVVIDLRSELKKYISSSPEYSFNKYVEEYMKTYDLIVIPKLETKVKSLVR